MPKLDFSQFHATGDHWPFTAYCRQFYGGGWNHIKLAWTYHRKDQVIGWFWGPTLCRIGKHRLETWHARATGKFTTMCKHCDFSRPATGDERFEPPDLPVREA